MDIFSFHHPIIWESVETAHYDSVLSISIIYQGSFFSDYPLHRVLCISYFASTGPEAIRGWLNQVRPMMHKAQVSKPISSVFFFLNNFIFLVVSCALKPIPMKLSNTHLHKRLQMWEIQIRI